MTIVSYVFGLLITNIEYGVGLQALAPRLSLYVIVSAALIVGVVLGSRLAWIAALVWEVGSLFPSLLWLVMEPKDDVLVSSIFLVVGVALVTLLLHRLTRMWVSPRGETSFKLDS